MAHVPVGRAYQIQVLSLIRFRSLVKASLLSVLKKVDAFVLVSAQWIHLLTYLMRTDAFLRFVPHPSASERVSKRATAFRRLRRQRRANVINANSPAQLGAREEEREREETSHRPPTLQVSGGQEWIDQVNGATFELSHTHKSPDLP